MKLKTIIGPLALCALAWLFTFQAIGIAFFAYLSFNPLPEEYLYYDVAAFYLFNVPFSWIAGLAILVVFLLRRRVSEAPRYAQLLLTLAIVSVWLYDAYFVLRGLVWMTFGPSHSIW